jgi:hypothetical protein
MPIAIGAASRGGEVGAFAMCGTRRQCIGLRQRRARIAEQGRLGEREQEARTHHVREHPLRVFGDGRVDVGDGRVEERRHAPQRRLRMIERRG